MLKKSTNMPLKIEYNIVSDKVIQAFLRENIELKSGAYNYNEYSLLINNSEDIMQDIESNFDIYLAQAKENENTLKKSMKIDNLKNSLASTDYQIIKCVESYMIDSILPYDFASLLYDRMSWRDEINSIQADSLTIDSTLEQEKTKKIAEMMACCQNIISTGIDYNEEHYRLNTTDQINLTSLGALAQQGKSVPYHADGQICRIYSSEEMLGLVQAATQFIIYNTTYFNLLKHTILDMTDIEEVKQVEYGTELSSEYQTILNTILTQG